MRNLKNFQLLKIYVREVVIEEMKRKFDNRAFSSPPVEDDVRKFLGEVHIRLTEELKEAIEDEILELEDSLRKALAINKQRYGR